MMQHKPIGMGIYYCDISCSYDYFSAVFLWL